MTRRLPPEQEARKRGWELAPARLPREDVASLRRLYHDAHRVVPPAWLGSQPIVTVALHVDREDQRKLALAKLGAQAPQVRVQASAQENAITVSIVAAASSDDWTEVASHKFRRSTNITEWTRILGRHCRHALGVLAHMRAPTLAQVFGVSKVS